MGVGALILRRYRHLCTLALEDENFMKVSCRACLLSYCFFGDKKIAFKSSLDLYLHPSINKFKLKERYALRLLLICLEALEEGLSCFHGKDWEGVSGTYYLKQNCTIGFEYEI